MEGCFLSLPQAINSALLTSCVLCICGVSIQHLQEVGHSFSTPKETRSLGFAQLLYINNFLILLEYSLFILSLSVLRLFAQWCLTLCSPMDCSPPGSSVHRDSPGKNTWLGYHGVFQGIFLNQGWTPSLKYPALTPPGKPKIKHTCCYTVFQPNRMMMVMLIWKLGKHNSSFPQPHQSEYR